jgi:hypothetical protein
VKRNANLAFLRAALPPEPLSPRCRLARFVQGVLEEHYERRDRNADEETPLVQLRPVFKRPWLVRYSVAALLAVLVCGVTTSHAPLRAGRVRAASGSDSGQVSAGCRGRFIPNRKFPGVYKLVDLRSRCRTGDITFAADDDTGGQVPSSLAESFVMLYMVQKRDGAATDIVAIRPCPSESRGCEPGEFYRVSGATGLGGRVRLRNGDLIAFERRRLEQFLAGAVSEAPTDGSSGEGR